MTPEAIIRDAAADGVCLTLTSGGGITANGERRSVDRWLSTIRENRVGIVAALKAAANQVVLRNIDQGTTMTTSQESAISGWLALIGESDQSIIDHVINQCHTHKDAREYFLGRASKAGAITSSARR